MDSSICGDRALTNRRGCHDILEGHSGTVDDRDVIGVEASVFDSGHYFHRAQQMSSRSRTSATTFTYVGDFRGCGKKILILIHAFAPGSRQQSDRPGKQFGVGAFC
jgi:hypothetical protein